MNTLAPNYPIKSPIIQKTIVSPRFMSTSAIDNVEISDKTNPNSKAVDMIMTLLKSSLNEDDVNIKAFKGATYHDWQKFIEIANEASVTGMAFESVHKLPKGTIPIDVFVKMGEFTKETEAKHLAQEVILGKLSKQYESMGAEMIQLKGAGLSMNYPVPQHRFGGDIDIFTRQKGTITEGYSNSWDMINKAMIKQGYEVEDYKLKQHKHSEFEYDGVRIENHNYFANKERMSKAKLIDDYLHKNLNPKEQILPNGTKILVPSKEFNNVFLSHHAFQHFVFGGLDLHHLTDWSTHLKKDGFQFPEELKGGYYEKFTYALTNLSNKYLGTNIKVPEDKEFEEKIWKRMLSPEDEPIPKEYNKFQTFAFKVKRLYNHAKSAKEYTGVPITRVFVDAGLIKLVNPKAILRKA